MSEPSAESSALGELRTLLGTSSKSIEDSLLKTVRERPAVLVDILFPVILPAIRRSIATLLQSMVEELNHVLEKSLSLRSLRWRIEAFRTRRPYAEIALLRSVRFEIVDIFLVHRNTGLLILHAVSPKARVQEAESISTLLSAIQDYIRESFHLSDDQNLNRLQMGEYSMWIEQGPHALIAARTKGPIPKEFHTRLQALIEVIHRERSANLESFVGDTTPFQRFRPALEECLRFNSTTPTPSLKPRKTILVLLTFPLLALITWFAWSYYRKHEKNQIVEQLTANAGVLITDSFRSDGKIVVQGFRDPLTVIDYDPKKVDLRLRPYLSLDPRIASRRAKSILTPPVGATVSLDEDSMIVIEGEAPYSWLRKVRRDYPQVAGARGVRTENFRTTEDREFETVRMEIENQPLYFASGSSALRGENQVILTRMIPSLQRLQELAASTGRVFQLEARGSVDSTGGDSVNERLGLERAESVAELLRRYGIPANTTADPLPLKEPLSRLDFLQRHVILEANDITI